MSHILRFQTEVREQVAIQGACDRLKLPLLVFDETKLFISSTVRRAVRLPERGVRSFTISSLQRLRLPASPGAGEKRIGISSGFCKGK